MKVIVAHPNKQHSLRLAIALNKIGYLDYYITTVYDKDKSITSFLKFFSGKKYKNKIASKKSELLPNEKIKQFMEFQGILFLIMIRVPILKRIYRKYGAWMKYRFGIKVAKFSIKHHVDAVIMFDTTADSCFKYLKKHEPKIIRILDMSSNVSKERLEIYKNAIKETNCDALKKENIHIWNKKNNEKNLRELKNSDFIFVPSHFSEKGIIKQGINQRHILYNPYGVDTEKFKNINRKFNKFSKIIIAYSGSITYGKGVSYMLEALSKNTLFEYEIYLMGNYKNSSKIYREYSSNKNIHFMGFIQQDELLDIYNKSNIFLFPSYGEGLSLAALEAMACGLPVICSNNSGVNDLIENYKNGIVFETGNEKDMLNALNWMYINQDKLKVISDSAIKTASEYSWDSYYERIEKFFKNLMR